MIRYILLGFLNYEPMTGYDLKQTIDTSTAHFWHAHHSQIYTTLRQMEQEGLLTSQYIQEEGQPNRRVYTLTEAGKTELRTWLDQPMMEMNDIKEELLVRLFFSAQRDPQKVLDELKLQRQLHRQKLKAYHDLGASEMHKHTPYVRDAAFWQATLNMGIKYEEMYLEWLKETIATIEKL